MTSDALPGYWYSRFVFERGLAAIYLVAFICAANQFVPLLGEHGLLPVTRFVRVVPFRAAPSLFYLAPRDAVFRAAAWIGIVVSALMLTSLPERLGSIASAAGWAILWALYLSFVNVGQTFYAFGWESLLLETGFYAIVAGGFATMPSGMLIWIWRWVLFRVMFGAGLIKIRGDSCWRDLTCLDYYFETQPIPNRLSWYFHWLPHWLHHAGVVINHVVELGAPFLYFLPQPFAAVGGILTIGFQLVLIASGNLSWLNWLTIVLCIPTLDDRWWSWLPIAAPALQPAGLVHRGVIAVVAAVVAVMSIGPIRNMLSPNQVMNTSFNTIQLVNTYGAFGSITRTRNEVVIEGTSDATLTDATTWRPYEFKGKPGDPARSPIQIAPYHLRLDWLMWFAAFSTPEQEPWFAPLLVHLLQGDPDTLSLLASNPFPDRPPRWIRARYYEYRFTTPQEHQATGRWWTRRDLGLYMPPISLRSPS
ncbi:MAG TPA: lipase maturation factor family protein [Vicinamibacterales bacterium]|nr:lipase maturation factor family protein [Vicinamibacterales bacterium]